MMSNRSLSLEIGFECWLLDIIIAQSYRHTFSEKLKRRLATTAETALEFRNETIHPVVEFEMFEVQPLHTLLNIKRFPKNPSASQFGKKLFSRLRPIVTSSDIFHPYFFPKKRSQRHLQTKATLNQSGFRLAFSIQSSARLSRRTSVSNRPIRL